MSDEQKPTRLSHRETRQNADVRTIAHLLSTSMGILSRLCTPKTLAAAAEKTLVIADMLRMTARPDRNALDYPDTSKLTDSECAIVITGMATGLCAVSEVEDVRRAVRWLDRRDDQFWQRVSDQLRELKRLEEQQLAEEAKLNTPKGPIVTEN